MQNLLSLWTALSLRRRVIVAAATLAMFLTILAIARVAGTPGMALLYSGLDPATAGNVVAALEQKSASYEIRGDAIYVDETTRDSLRMVLAAAGLPAVGGTGYELLDGLSGFGTTSQMFDAAYWRAKEGELARTILASPQIKAARVHIAQAPTQLFRPDEKPTASVTVTTSSGSLAGAQAKALRHLVAAAVAGMQPDDVAVIDSVGGLIPTEADDSAPGIGGDQRAAEIRKNVERLLTARVGPGKAVVEVSVDVATDREQVTETTFDPQGRVAISSETQEKTGSTAGSGGNVTVASNLPNGAANSTGGDKSQTSDKQERVNYEVSETKREIVKAPGSVRKISVAVLIDGQNVTAADGTVSFQPRPEEELATLRELVTSAAGLDSSRGDALTLKSMPFEAQPELGTMAEAGPFAHMGQINLMSAIQLGVLALVALVLGLFVIRPLLSSPRRNISELPAPLALPRMGGAADDQHVLTGEIADSDETGPMAFAASDEEDRNTRADAVARLRRLIEERQSESVEILRGWMEMDEERA